MAERWEVEDGGFVVPDFGGTCRIGSGDDVFFSAGYFECYLC